MRITEDGQRVGRIGGDPYRAFGIGQSFDRVSGPEKQSDVIIQNGGILALETKRGFKEVRALLKFSCSISYFPAMKYPAALCA